MYSTSMVLFRERFNQILKRAGHFASSSRAMFEQSRDDLSSQVLLSTALPCEEVFKVTLTCVSIQSHVVPYSQLCWPMYEWTNPGLQHPLVPVGRRLEADRGIFFLFTVWTHF